MYLVFLVFLTFQEDFLLEGSISSIIYINIFSRVAFLYQGFLTTGKKNYSQFSGKASPNEETPKLNREILFTEKVARQPRIHLARYVPLEDRETVLQYRLILQSYSYLLSDDGEYSWEYWHKYLTCLYYQPQKQPFCCS